jgi:hypothetical protein
MRYEPGDGREPGAERLGGSALPFRIAMSEKPFGMMKRILRARLATANVVARHQSSKKRIPICRGRSCIFSIAQDVVGPWTRSTARPTFNPTRWLAVGMLCTAGEENDH